MTLMEKYNPLGFKPPEHLILCQLILVADNPTDHLAGEIVDRTQREDLLTARVHLEGMDDIPLDTLTTFPVTLDRRVVGVARGLEQSEYRRRYYTEIRITDPEAIRLVFDGSLPFV